MQSRYAVSSMIAIPTVALVLLLAGLLTAWELPLLSKFHQGNGPDTLHIVFIKGFTDAWILIIVMLVRLSGYRLSTPRNAGSSI